MWKDVDEVVKASNLKDKEKDIFKIMIEIPKKVQWLVEVMEEVPKGEKSKY